MKMKKSFRRALALILTVVIAVSLAACGGKGGSESDKKKGNSDKTSSSSGPAMPEVTSKDGVVKTVEAKIDDPEFEADGLQVLAMEKDRIYGFSYVYESEGSNGTELVSFKPDGSDFKKTKYKVDEANEEVSASAFYDGNFLLVVSQFSNSEALDYVLENGGEEGKDVEVPDELSEDATATFELRSVTPEGKENWAVKLEPENKDYFFVSSVCANEEGVMVVSNEGVNLYSLKDGSLIRNICKTDPDTFEGILYVLTDGTVIMIDDTTMNNKVNVYNEKTGEFVEKRVLPSSMQSAMVFPGTKYSFYLAGDDGVYGVDLKSGDITPVVNYVNSDLDLQGLARLVELDEGRLLIQAYENDNSVGVFTLEPVAPEDVEEKKELTLAGYYMDAEVRTQVIEFNKTNSKYRIKIVDYSQYDLESDYDENNVDNDTTGLTRLNTDIGTGNAPDIMLLSAGMPINSFISKGVLMDLTDKYESDKEIDKSDFLKNIVDAFRTDGKMFVVVPSFTIVGVSGKTKYIGDGKDLTLEKAKKIAASKGINENALFGLADRAGVFSSAIEFSGDQFIDTEKNTCDFNNEEFRQLLEFAKNCPETISEEQYNDYYTQYLSDSALLAVQYINSIFDYYYMTRQLFGELNVTVTGFPSKNNKGPIIASYNEFGISNSTSEPEGCWEFVRRFLLPDYQMSIESSLPISEKAIDAQGQRIIDQNKMDAESEEDSDLLTGVDYEDDSEGEVGIAESAIKDGTWEESEELTGKLVSEEEFDGTHEEYEQYLAEEAANAETASTSALAEEVVIGEDEIMDNSADFGEGPNTLPEFGQSDIDAVKNILKSMKYQVNSETQIMKIIKEESAAYFAGQKSAEEVSDIIQSRVQVYLKENE